MEAMVAAEPWRVKVVEKVKRTTRAERERILRDAHYNIFSVRAEDVYIDLLTDSGTSAMSDDQWAGLMVGDESYAGCRNFFSLKEAVRDIFGFEHVIPTHQGRAAEHVLFLTMLKPGQYVVGNGIFDTTAAHIMNKGCIPVDLMIKEGEDPTSLHPFKGNMDVDRLREFIREKGPDKVAMIILVVTCNNNGGQPVSMANIKAVKEVASAYGIPLFLDAARYAENAYFIKEREPGYQDKSSLDIAREMFSYADGCTMSAKKTALVNIGGFIALKDESVYYKALEWLILFEGFPTYGGLAGRDLEAMARGLYEGIDDDLLEGRIRQVRYLGQRLIELGVTIVQPVGGHGVYLDALTALPNIPPENLPGETFVAELYLEAGVRAICLGRLAFGGRTDPETGEPFYPKMEMIRFAIPRRVYTDRHMDVVAQAVANVLKGKEKLRGLRMTYETPVLKHFLARFERL